MQKILSAVAEVLILLLNYSADNYELYEPIFYGRWDIFSTVFPWRSLKHDLKIPCMLMTHCVEQLIRCITVIFKLL